MDKRQNSINMTNGNRKSNIRPLLCTTENYLQNHIHQQCIVPGNHLLFKCNPISEKKSSSD